MFICEYCKIRETCKRTHNRAHDCSRFEEDVEKHQEILKKAEQARAKLYKLCPWARKYKELFGGSKIEEE